MPIFDDDNNLPDPNAVVASQLANDVGATAPVDPQSVASALLRQHLDPNWPPKPDRSASAAPGSFDPSQFLGAPVGNMSGEDASQYLGTPVDDSATKAPPSEENIGVGGNVKAAGKGFAQEAIKAPAELAQGAAVGINAITPTMVATAGGEGSPLSVDDLPGGANNPPAEPVEQNPVLGKVYKGAGAVKDFAEKAVPMSDAEKASLGGQVGTGLGGMVAPLAATALGGPAAGAAVMGLQSAGQTYDAARKKGASPEDAATAAGLDGAVGAALGMLPLGIVLKPFEALMPAAGAGVSDIVTRALAHAAQSSVTFATVGEAQQYIAGKVAEAYYDPNGGYSWDTKRVLGELLTGGLIGFGSGLFHESLSVRARGAAVSDSIEHAKKYDGSTSDATNPDGMPRWQDDPNNWQNVGVGNGPGPQPNTGGGGAGAQPGGQQGSQQSGAQGGSQQGNPGTSAPDRAKEWHDAWGQTQGAAEPSNKRWSTLAGVMQNAYGFRSTDLKNASFSDLRNFMANADALTAAGFDKAAIAKMTPGDMAAAVLDIQMKAKGGAQADAQPGAQAQPEPTAKEAEDILRQHGYDDATIAGMDAGVRVKTAHGLRQAYPNGPQSQPGTSSSPIDLQTGADVARAAAVASTDHSHAQGEAGNRQSGHAVWNGLGVKFEVAAGGTRKGTVPDTGAPWETTHPHAYGEFKDLPNAADGMKPDVIVGDHPQAPSVYVIDEIDPQTGKYRQSKSFIGFQTPAEVAQSYAGISSKSMAGIGGMRAFGRDEFTKFAKDGGLSKPVTDLKAKSAEKSTGNQTENPENQTGNQPGNRTEQAAGSPINADLVRQLPDELMSPRILRAFEGMFDENGNRHTDIGIANNDPRATRLYNKAGITDPKLGLMTWQGLQALKAERARRDGKPFEASKPASKPGMAEDTPSAEPLADIQAQARDLADKKNRRGALWLPKDTVDHLSKLGKLDEVIGGHPAQHNFDGKGGILVARDLNTIAQAKKDKKAGRSIQEIVGRLVGAGSGKPADATHVVQQLDEQGNVTRERAVRESDVKRTYQAFSTPGRSVRVVSPEEAVKRRADLVSREAGIEQPAPEPRESSPHDHHAVAEELKQAGIDPAQVRPADIARAGEIHAEEGLAPLDAFAVAVLRHLVETGAVSREAVQGILGHERTAKLLDAINGDRGRRPARLEDASAAARRPAAEAQSGVSAGSDKQNAEAAASQSDEHGQAGQTVGTAGAEANGRERSVSDTGHSEAGGTELQAASGKQHAEPAGAHGAVGERAGAKPGSANGKAPAAAKNLKRKPWSILEYIGHRGGLKPSAEWEGMGLTFRSNVIVPNVGRRSLIKRDGMQVDRLIEALREGGYIENAPEDRPDDVGVMNHVYDLVEKDWAAHENKDESGKQYAIGVEPPISSAEQHRIDESWEEHGARTEEARGRLHSALDEAGIPVHSIGPSLEAETVRLMLDSEDAGEDHDPLDLLERAAVLLENERDLIHDDDTGVGEEVFHALDEERAPQASGADHAEIGEHAAEEEGGSGEVSGVSPERGESAGQEPGSAATERTEAGEQGVIPGAERIGQGEHAQRKSDEKLKPTKAQQPADHGLFGDSSAQTDLVDMAKAKPQGIAGELQGNTAAAETFRKVMEAGQPKDAAELLNRADDLFRSREDESARGGILDRVKRVLRTLQHGKSGYTDLEGALTQLRGTLDHITTEPEGDIGELLREKESEGAEPEGDLPGKGTLANRIGWMLKNEDWTKHQWKNLVEKSTPDVALKALERAGEGDLDYPAAYRASTMAHVIEDIARDKARVDVYKLKGKGKAREESRKKLEAEAAPFTALAERAKAVRDKFDAIQAKHVADAVKEKGITDRMPVKITGGFYDGRTGARMSEVYGQVNLRKGETSLQIITAPRGDWTFIGPDEIRNDLSPATEEEVSKAHTAPQWQFPFEEGGYSDEERRQWLADRLNAVASGDAEAELHDDYITIDGEVVGQGINISSDKPKEIIQSFLEAAQKEAGLGDSDIVHIEQAINEQLEGQRAAAEEDRVAEEKKRADTLQGMKDVKAGKAVTDEVREILQDGGFIKGKGDKTKLSAKGEHQLTGLLKHEKEEAAEKAALDALPEPKDIKGLTKVYRDTIDELDFAVRQADGNAAGELFDKLTLIEQRANNNVTFGMAADDSPAEQVRQGGAVPIGSIPKWGQRGVFETEVGGVKAIVKSGFYLGDSIYAAGPGPFPSETGYRSFSHMHDIPEEALGHSVEEFAHKQIEHAIAEQKKSNKGKLGTPDTWYRLPKDWAETDEIGRRNGDPMVAGRTPEKEEQLAESRRMQERIRENGNEIDFPDDEEPETPTAETPSGVFPPSAVGTGAVEPFDSEKAIVDITRRIIEAANHVSTFTDLVRNDASNADLLKAFKQNIGSHVTGADINRVSATARGASLHLLMPGPDGETIKPVLSGAKLADAIREAAKAPETGPSDSVEQSSQRKYPRTVFRGVEGSAVDPVKAARVFKGGDLGDGIYVTPSEGLAKSYGGGPKAKISDGTRLVHRYELGDVAPAETAYVEGGKGHYEPVRIVDGTGKELWHGDWSASNMERALSQHPNIRLVVGTDNSIGINQIAVRDPSILKPTERAAKRATGENIWADFRDGKKPTEFMGRPVPENAVPFKYAKAGDVLPDGKIVVERKIDRKARAQQLAEEVGGIVSLDGPKHWAVLKPTDVAATPEAETSDSADNVRSDLETKGAARFGKIDYKIAQLPDNGSFYFTRTENGVRVEKGPGYPARWNRETAIEQAMTEVNFDRGLALSEEPKKPNIKLEDQNDERSGTGKLGSQPLEGEPASDLQGSEAERDSERGASGSSTASSEGDRATDGEGLSGARGEGSSASNVHPLTPGGKRTKSGAGGRAGRNGAGVSEKPAGTDRLEPAVPPQDAPSVPAINYRITDETELGKGAESVKLADNLRAIETLKQVERETRRATPEEQRILARYVGWGGLANAFPDRVSGEYKPDWKARGEKLAALLTPAELKAAQRTTRNAHYTSRPVIDAMWKAAERLGFKGGLSLESSMGVGNFLGLVPESIAGRTRFVGIEFDSVTSRIAKLLYPQDTVLHSGFQRVPLSDGEFVLSIGNPPFGAESLRFQNKPELYGLSIHNQFFLASLDALRPGGLHIAVVSHFLLDAEGKDAREKMAVKADLLGAIRLPETAFKENARTEVVTDIVLMQRRAPEEQRAIQALVDRIHQSGHAKKIEDDRRAAREELARKVPWVETAKVKDPLGGEDLKVNTYFAKHPDMIMGRLERSGSMRGPEKGLNVVLDKNADLSKLLNEAVDKLPSNKLDVDAETMQRTLERHKSLSESLKIALAGHEPGHLELNEHGKLTQIYERETPSGDFEPLRREVTPDSPWSQDLMLDSDGRYYKLEPLLRAVQLKDMRLRVQAKLNELPKGSHERQGLTDQLKELDQQIKEAEKTGAKAKQGNRNIYARQYFPDNKVPEGMRLGKTKYDRLVDLTKLRDHTRKQIELETEDYPEADLEANRAKLARAYRDYTRENGLLHEKKTSQLLGEMPDGALVMSLEHGYRREITAAKAKRTGDKARPASAKQSAILSSRVVPKYAPPTKAGSAADAISIALSERGHLDVDRIADLLGTTKDEAEKALGDGDKPLAFYDPESQRWETRNGYLSGQVRRKLEAAKGAGLEKNVKALEEVQPERWNADQVTPIIGANWIPPKVYEDFVSHLLGTHATVQYGKATNAYNLLVGEYGNDKASQWGTQDLTPDTIIRNLLNSRPQKVMIPGDKDHGPTEDKEASALAQLKANEILSEFGDWVFRDGDRRNQLVDIYNDKFNTRVLRQHDGSHMTLPGKVPDQVIKMRRHQMNAAWRGVYDRFLLLDHVVGAGKTFTAIARAMERRRMGLSKKPMIVVPNHLVDQWAADVYRLYPGAKVLSAGNKQFDRKNRRRLFARIATGDWDVVIVPHSSFGFIGISPDTELRFLDEELRIALEAIDEAKKEAGSQTWPKPYTVKEAERLVTAIEGRMDALRNARRDNMLTFEQLGVDDLTVDEAHEFKNLFYSSHLQNVRGMGNKTGSKKASDLYNKVRVLRETPSSTVTFMTGTPISNSAVEMYTMMRYLAADELKALGIEHFDAWRNQYVSAEPKWEPTEAGGLKEVTRLGRSWSNMRALMELYYSFTDSVTQEDINKAYAEDNNGAQFPVPNVKSGGRKEIIVEPTPAQQQALQAVIEGFNSLPTITDIDERNAERLRLMDRARKVSLDVRAVNPRNPSKEEGGKLDQISDNVARIYKQWDKDAGTQLIFLDRSVPKAKGDDKAIKAYDDLIRRRDEALASNNEAAYRDVNDELEKYDPGEIEELRRAQSGGWNAYDQIKQNLIKRGVKADEIRFVQDANNDAEKKALFEAVNDGTIRVLVGSTQRMGAGTNVQERLVALHHGDVTWKPSDIEQREGRIIRQGNKLLEKYGKAGHNGGPPFEVEILAYATKRTVDAKMWDLNAEKLKMINGIRKYDGAFNMNFEDEDSVSMAEIAALASGDPLLLERVKLSGEIDKLELAQRGFSRKMFGVDDAIDRANRVIRDYPQMAEEADKRSSVAKQDVFALREAAKKRAVTVEGETFNDQFAAAQKANTEIDRQRGDDENAKYSVNIDGKQLTSKEAITGAIHTALGDSSPFEAKIGGETYWQRFSAAKAIAEKLNSLAEETKEGDGKEIKLGRMFNADLVGVLQGYRGAIGIGLVLSRDGKTVAASSMKDVGREKQDDLIESGIVSPALLRGRIEDLEKDFLGIASSNGDRYRNSIANATRDLPGLLEQKNEKFPQADRLSELRAKLREIIAELDRRTKEAEGNPSAPAIEKIDPDKFMPGELSSFDALANFGRMNSLEPYSPRLGQFAASAAPQEAPQSFSGQASRGLSNEAEARRLQELQAHRKLREQIPGTPEHEAAQQRVKIRKIAMAWLDHWTGGRFSTGDFKLFTHDMINSPPGVGGYGDTKMIGTIGGLYHPADMAVYIATSDPSFPNVFRTLAHEGGLHLVLDHFATPQEWAVLRSPREQRRLAEIIAAKKRGFSVEDVLKWDPYEIDANAGEFYFDDLARGGKGNGFHAIIRRIFDKILNFFRALGNYLRNHGFDTADWIFDRAFHGEMGKRPSRINDLHEPSRIIDEIRAGREGQAAQARPYENVPDNLMGFRKEGPQKGYDETNYPHEQHVEVHHEGAEPFVDTIKGMNKAHALERARRNWGTNDVRAIEPPQTDTPQFKRWFGDSKVVDRNGEPKVVYHGTDADDFNSFARTEDIGFHFGTIDAANDRLSQTRPNDDPNVSWQDTRIMPVYLRIENPMRMSDLHDWNARQVLDDLEEAGILSEDQANEARENDVNIDRLFVQDALKAHGYDGIVYENNSEGRREIAPGVHERGDSYIVFDPTQIKSATGNNGAFTPDSPDIAMRRRAAAGPGSPKRSRNSRIRDAIDRILDSRLGQKVVENFDDLSAPVRRLQDELIDRKGGSALSDQQDFYTRKRLYPGRVATETQGFNKAYLDPMVEFMRKRDISLDQAANYVEAMHVGERNAYIGKMYPAGHQFNKAMSDKKVIGGSGRSQEWADNVIADAARTNKTRDLNRVHDYIQAIRHFILNKLVNGHLLTPEEARQWRERYEHYVDLRGYEDNPDDKPSDYREPSQFNVRGKEAQMAMGRTTVANNPIVNMLDQAYRAIDRVEKNRYLHAVWNAFGRAAKDAPGSVSDIVKFDHTKPKKVIDKNTGLVHQVHDNSFVMSPNTVAVKIDGITHYMVFANREVAEAVKRMRPDDVGDFFRGVLRLENKLKAMWTHWSPDFLARHFLARYPIEGAMNSFEQKESGKHSVTKYLRQSYPIVGAAYKAIRAEEAGAKPTGDKDVEELRKYYAEMKQRGGSMAFRQMRDVDLIREHLQHELKALQGSALSNTVYRHEQFVRALDGVTNAMDNALRLSAYASARKQGKTEQQAALLAREATIDFMRKGRLAAKVGIYFPFGNVAINTGSRMARAFYRSKMMRRAIFGMAMAGFTLGMWNYLIGGSDEHGNPYFEKIPTWDREKNFIWLNPFEHDEKGNPQVYKIPNQFNYSLPMNIGYSVATRMFGKEGWLETLSSVAKSAVTAFTPLDEEGNLAALPAPEVARPAVHILTNKNSFGNPIHNDEAFNRGPNAYSGRKDKDGQVRTGSGWKWFAEALNNLSGGDSRHSGYVDVYPESIREAFNYAGQAQGGLLQHLYETLYNAPVNKGQMAEPTQVPIERVFRGNDYDAHDRYEIGHRKFLNKHPWLK